MSISRITIAALSAALLFLSVDRVPAQDLPVTSGLELWLDATDASTLFIDDLLRDPIDPNNVGGPVGGWKDKSPNGYEIFQFDEVLKPSYHDSAMNGQPAVRFTGAENDGMEFFLFDLQRPYTAFIVNQYWGNTRGRTLQSTDINWLLGLWNGNVGHFAEGWVSANGGIMPATNNVPYVVDTVGTETSSSFFLNGEEFVFDSAPVGAPGALGFGSVGSFPAEVSDADVSEVIIYNRALDQSELDSVRAYLNDKYDTEPYTLPPPDPFSVQKGIVGKFTGADPGETQNVVDWSFSPETGVVYTFADADGLDFEGNFVQAINVGGPGLLTIGDAEFHDGSELGFDNPGVTITDANEIPAWNAPAFGDTPGDDSLETVMQSIRWNTPPGVEVDIDVQAGEFYKLQLLFMEQCCNRGFDILLDGEEVVSNMVVNEVHDGINNPAAATFFTHTFQAQDDVLNILLGGAHMSQPDNNPILSGVTLELLDAPPPMGIPGDYNGNGAVEQADLDLVLLNWGTGGVPGGWINDLPTGNIDQAELDGVLLNWGNMAALGENAAVPEPSTLLLAVCLGLSGLLAARRGRR